MPSLGSAAEAAHGSRYAFDLRSGAAFAVYLALAIIFFARGLDGRISSAYIGKGVDPPQLMWLMAWWPHALARGLNPLFTDAIWAPRGLNLAWATSMPLISLLAMIPITQFGPAAVYNALCILAIASAAWSAFLLCRYVTDSWWASLVGGYIFGFSAYILGQSLAHLNLLCVFPIPMFALLLIRAFRGDIPRGTLLAGLMTILVVEFLIFIELFATMTLFACIAFAVLFLTGPNAYKARVVSLLPTIALSYAIAMVMLLPILYCMMSLGYEPGPQHPPLLYSTDLLNLVIPTATMEFGRAFGLKSISEHFLGFIYEAGGYIGVPLIAIAVIFGQRKWHQPWARAVLIFAAVAIVLSLGPFLIIYARPVFALPELLIGVLPLIGKALPGRFIVYGFLALCLIAALFLADQAEPPWLRIGFGSLIAVSMLPNLSAGFWIAPIEVPWFFSDGLYKKYLPPDSTALILPYGINGSSMLWQLESKWYFKMAGGYAGNPPLAFRQWPIVRVFYRVSDVDLPDAGDQLKAFLATHGVQTVLIDDREEQIWRPLMVTLGVMPVESGGMTIYQVDRAALAPWREANALAMEARLDRTRFAALVAAAEKYLQSGHSAESITPFEVRKLGLMPSGWVHVPKRTEPPWDEGGMNLPRFTQDPHQSGELWLRAQDDSHIEVGVTGWYPALRTVLKQYRHEATGFAPLSLDQTPAGEEADLRGRLTITFTPQGLARAAAIAANELAGKQTSGKIEAAAAKLLSR